MKLNQVQKWYVLWLHLGHLFILWYKYDTHLKLSLYMHTISCTDSRILDESSIQSSLYDKDIKLNQVHKWYNILYKLIQGY